MKVVLPASKKNPLGQDCERLLSVASVQREHCLKGAVDCNIQDEAYVKRLEQDRLLAPLLRALQDETIADQHLNGNAKNRPSTQRRPFGRSTPHRSCARMRAAEGRLAPTCTRCTRSRMTRTTTTKKPRNPQHDGGTALAQRARSALKKARCSQQNETASVQQSCSSKRASEQSPC